VKKEEEARRLA